MADCGPHEQRMIPVPLEALSPQPNGTTLKVYLECHECGVKMCFDIPEQYRDNPINATCNECKAKGAVTGGIPMADPQYNFDVGRYLNAVVPGNPDVRSVEKDPRGIPVLLSAMDLARTDALMQANGCRSLCELAMDQRSAISAINHNCIVLLLRAINEHKSVYEVQRLGTLALARLCEIAQKLPTIENADQPGPKLPKVPLGDKAFIPLTVAARIVCEGGLPILLSAWDAHCANGEIQNYIITVFEELARDQDTRLALVKADSLQGTGSPAADQLVAEKTVVAQGRQKGAPAQVSAGTSSARPNEGAIVSRILRAVDRHRNAHFVHEASCCAIFNLYFALVPAGENVACGPSREQVRQGQLRLLQAGTRDGGGGVVACQRTTGGGTRLADEHAHGSVSVQRALRAAVLHSPW